MGWTRPFLLALKGEYLLSTFPYSEKEKEKKTAFTELLCPYTTTRAERLTTKNSIVYDISCFTEKYIKTVKKKTSKHVSIVSFIVTVTPRLYICKPGQSTGSQYVSLCWQHDCEPPGKREAIWTAASRLETVETLATTIANHKKAHQDMDMDAEACNVSKQRLNKRS